MVFLFKQDIKTENRQSSKGNQLKWFNGETWYKADYVGYEAMAEYMVSHLLQYSTLKKEEYTIYEIEKIKYEYMEYMGCKSKNFLRKNSQLITLERLFQNFYGESLNKSIYTIKDHRARIQFLVENTVRITGLQDFGIYFSKLLTIDTFFLNEDRHTHNIAVLLDAEEKYQYCPIFDNGAAMLSDTNMDYPMHIEIDKLIPNVKTKTFCSNFEEQLDIVESLYGKHLKFCFEVKDVEQLLENDKCYPKEIKERVLEIIIAQKRKYNYLFQ